MIQARLIAIAVSLAMGFFAGWTVNGWRWNSTLVTAKELAETARIELASNNAKLIQEAAHAETKIQTKTITVIKRIAAINSPAACIDDSELQFIANWNEIVGQAREPYGAASSP